MAPTGRQRTFELVPNAPVLGQQHPGNDAQPVYSKPPMTTKQAKKLHNQKNKGPKLSKAEQRRIELMEQDRIRKEFEKEKAQARARTARERKRAKEEKEKEERRRKGLPLVDIHPSQDTISRFISRVGRVMGAKRDYAAFNTLDSVREDTETATDAGDSATDAGEDEQDEFDGDIQDFSKDLEPERQAKKPRLIQSNEKMADNTDAVSLQRRAGPVGKIAQEASCSRASSVDTDDPLNQALLEQQIIADLAQASSKKGRETCQEFPAVPCAEQSPTPVPQPAVPIISLSSASKEPVGPRVLQSRPQASQRPATLTAKEVPQSNAPAASRVSTQKGNNTFIRPNSLCVSALRPRPASKTAAPQLPNAPPKFKFSAVRSCSSVERPRFLPKHLNTAQQRRVHPEYHVPVSTATYALPSSTQAFLLDHVDELFPSPTQEARELLEDSLTESPEPEAHPSRLSINGTTYRSGLAIDHKSVFEPRVGSGHKLPTPCPPFPAAGDLFDSYYISTQDVMISTQDILDIDSPSKAGPVSAAPLLSIVNEGLSASAVHNKEAEKCAPNIPPVLDAVKSLTQPPQSSETRVDFIDAISDDAMACCSCGSVSGSRRTQCHISSCPAKRKHLSPQVTQRKMGDQQTAASRPLRSSNHRHPAVVQQRSTSNSNINNNNSNNHTSKMQAPNANTTPKRSPLKKRMFGSSGPGPEGLLAMERSYQEMRREERARQAQSRAQEKLSKSPTLPTEHMDMDISEFADDLLNDDFGETTDKGTVRRLSCAMQQDAGDEQHANDKKAATLAASQETDYGDIDGDEFDLLKCDSSWLDEDLDDI